MRLINIDDVFKQFPKADFDGDALENMKAYPHWKTDITGLSNILKSVPIIETCEDCISREALDNAISALTYWHPTTDGRLEVGGGFDKTVYKVEDVLRLTRVLPSVTPKQRVGKWIDCYGEVPIPNAGGFTETKHIGWTCSCCGENNFWIKSDYCPNCGAKMEVEE